MTDRTPGTRGWRKWKKRRHVCDSCGRVSHKSRNKIQHGKGCKAAPAVHGSQVTNHGVSA